MSSLTTLDIKELEAYGVRRVSVRGLPITLDVKEL